MITTDDVRAFALALPEVTEFSHHRFRVPGFKVRGTTFAGLEKGETSAVFCLSAEQSAAAVAAEPAIYEEVRRPTNPPSFLGVRTDLSRISRERARELVELAWRNKAPKRVVTAYDVGSVPQ
ncbi:hypothetical protein [Amycolatopsis sp.]|uniref:hypothetical protein n=1 Tax=Amycolatopsis sp. TaxID=37632 RepID=UPI002C9B4D5D|nr:hypothetical protein [Amycolatopsis sp.]HVV12407.1 hypothetical protein [Amycolatopsis sp.]